MSTTTVQCITEGSSTVCNTPVQMTLSENLFIACVVIFFLSFLAWSKILRPVFESGREYGL